VPEKILVRFIDVGRTPGQTYQYKVSVRMKNPNFGKESLVANAAMAKKRVLRS
jgi:hypothetical protein